MLSPRSLYLLDKAHPDLKRLFIAVAKKINIMIDCTLRGESDQEQAFRDGHSKAHFGQSPHNFVPSLAVDVVPLPTEWSDEQALLNLSIIVMETADEMEIDMTWGGSFPGDYGFKHSGDLPHYQFSNWLKLRGVIS